MSEREHWTRRLLQALVGIGMLVGVLRLFRRRRPRWSGVDPEDVRAGHELSDLSLPVVTAFGIGLVMSLVIIFAVITWFQITLAGPPASDAPTIGVVTDSAPLPVAEPRLETSPGETLESYRAADRQRLQRYVLVDRQAGTVRIPIEQAMDKLLAQGLPTRQVTVGAQPRDQALTLPSDASSGRVEERISP